MEGNSLPLTLPCNAIRSASVANSRSVAYNINYNITMCNIFISSLLSLLSSSSLISTAYSPPYSNYSKSSVVAIRRVLYKHAVLHIRSTIERFTPRYRLCVSTERIDLVEKTNLEALK